MRVSAIVLMIVLPILAACGGAGSPPPSETSANISLDPTPPTSDQTAAAENATMDDAAAGANPAGDQPAAADSITSPNSSYNGPAWTQIALTNARTGESFTLADFAGKTVYVHMMATWCTNCRANQTSLRESVIPQLAGDQFVFVSIDVQTGITASELASYADNNNFGWTFAVATPDFLRALGEQLGTTITNPPSTPHFYISPIGTVSALQTGFATPEDKLNQLRAFANS